MNAKAKIFLPNRIIHLNNGNIISISNSLNRLSLEPKLTISTYKTQDYFNSHKPDSIFNMTLKEANNFIQRELLVYNL